MHIIIFIIAFAVVFGLIMGLRESYAYAQNPEHTVEDARFVGLVAGVILGGIALAGLLCVYLVLAGYWWILSLGA